MITSVDASVNILAHPILSLRADVEDEMGEKLQEKGKEQRNMYSDRHSLMLGTAAMLIGFCFGIGTGFLIAPQSGVRTRRQLKHFTEDVIDDTKETIEEIIDQGKHLMAVR